MAIVISQDREKNELVFVHSAECLSLSLSLSVSLSYTQVRSGERQRLSTMMNLHRLVSSSFQTASLSRVSEGGV